MVSSRNGRNGSSGTSGNSGALRSGNRGDVIFWPRHRRAKLFRLSSRYRAASIAVMVASTRFIGQDLRSPLKLVQCTRGQTFS